MNRLIELLKMIVYFVVTVVCYMGVNQILIVANDIKIILPDFQYESWFGSGVTAEAEEKYINEAERDLYVEVIDEFLQKESSPMAGSGKDFVDYAIWYNLPVYLMVAMAGAESSFGKYGYASTGSYNAVGLGVHEDRKYKNWKEGIADMGFVLRYYYFDEGKDTTIEIQDKWAPRCIDNNSCDDGWAGNVDYFIKQLQNLENKKRQGEI